MNVTHRVCFAALIAATSFGAFAQTPAAPAAAPAPNNFDATHPRRAEVNGRLANQNARIDAERKDGQISKAQAQSLHAQDHAIRGEERTMASHDDGHITRADKRALNQQENSTSKEIGK
jgi:hypothetical protein